ncbi:MAG: MoaD/ThiS family protein [Candidatus Obscuribacterales bacterium]|jgi:hypothetical protein
MTLVKVDLTSALRHQIPNNLEIEALSIKEALEKLCLMYPDIRGKIFVKESSKLHPFVRLFLNGKEFPAARLQDNSEADLGVSVTLSILTAIAGG